MARRGNEGSEERLAEDEGVEARLLRRPALLRVEMEESLDEVDEGDAVAHLCAKRRSAYISVPSSTKRRREGEGKERGKEQKNAPLSTSASFNPFLTIGYCLMISGNVVAEKYFLLGCSFALYSCAYRSRLLSL